MAQADCLPGPRPAPATLAGGHQSPAPEGSGSAVNTVPERGDIMYEDFFGLAEKPFNLTPDPKFLYRSETHVNALDLIHFAIKRREGFTVVTGDIGTGKTTLCRAIVEQLDRKTFTAVIFNPLIDEHDLLKVILRDFGVISREDARQAHWHGVTQHDMVMALNDFLQSLTRLQASAVVIVDEAHHLSVPVLEQLRILSNLETNKEKLLQIVLVGQLDLQSTLRSPEMRQFDQRVSIRYEIKPLMRDEVGPYVSHRIAVAGGADSVMFTRRALDRILRYSGGVPRLINLLCDRSLLTAYSARVNEVEPAMVDQAAESLGLGLPSVWRRWFRRRTSIVAAALFLLFAAAVYALSGVSAVRRAFYQETLSQGWLQVPAVPPRPVQKGGPAAEIATGGPQEARLFTVAVSAEAEQADQLAFLAWQMKLLGYPVAEEATSPASVGSRHRVYVGRYISAADAEQDQIRFERLLGWGDSRVVALGNEPGL